MGKRKRTEVVIELQTRRDGLYEVYRKVILDRKTETTKDGRQIYVWRPVASSIVKESKINYQKRR